MGRRRHLRRPRPALQLVDRGLVDPSAVKDAGDLCSPALPPASSRFGGLRSCSLQGASHDMCGPDDAALARPVCGTCQCAMRRYPSSRRPRPVDGPPFRRSPSPDQTVASRPVETRDRVRRHPRNDRASQRCAGASQKRNVSMWDGPGAAVVVLWRNGGRCSIHGPCSGRTGLPRRRRRWCRRRYRPADGRVAQSVHLPCCRDRRPRPARLASVAETRASRHAVIEAPREPGLAPTSSVFGAFHLVLGSDAERTRRALLRRRQSGWNGKPRTRPGDVTAMSSGHHH
jgi:hypothetical protein